MDTDISSVLKGPSIIRGPAVTEDRLARAEAEIGCPLPPSYRRLFLEYGDGFEMQLGNWLRVSSLETMVADTKEVREWAICPLKDLIVFGGTGVDAEMWAFYTAAKAPNGEYPVVWVTPGSIDSNGYVLANSGFDAFLNVWTRFVARMGRSAPIMAVLGEPFFRRLYRAFDRKRNIRSSDFYKQAVAVDELRKQIDALKDE